MNDSLSSSSRPSQVEEPPTKLRHYFRFTLKAWVIVILLAATAGLAAHNVLRVVEEDQKRRSISSGISNAQYELRVGSYVDYRDIVEAWYMKSAGNNFISRDELEVVMRKAERLQNPEAHLKELERIAGARREGDVFLVYSVSGAVPTNTPESTQGNAEKPQIAAPSGLYAFLVRNDLVVFFAERKPTDAGWVERSVGTSYMESYYSNLNLFVIPGAMLLVVFAFFGVRVLVGLFRYFSAPPPSLAAGSKKPAATESV